MRKALIDFISGLASYIYKNKCVSCKKLSNFSICEECFANIPLNTTGPVRIINNVRVYSATRYAGEVRQAILGIKFNRKKDLAVSLAKLMQKYWESLDLSNQNYTVISVPIHKKKLRERGYNQMELIGKAFCYLTGNKFIPDTLIRVKNTLPQYGLSPSERVKNLHEAFKINTKHRINPPILIIDDIITTGATLEEIIGVLKSENHNNIIVFTLSHSPPGAD